MIRIKSKKKLADCRLKTEDTRHSPHFAYCLSKLAKIPLAGLPTAYLFRLLLTAFCLLAFTTEINPTIRYVSQTGSSTPPYTTWETAADSIQKCIDYSVDGDTIVVANGVYYESLIVNKYLWLIGSSMDSTVIDGTGLTGTTVAFSSSAYIRFFNIKGNGIININNYCIYAGFVNVFIENCRLQNSGRGIALLRSSSIVNQCFITNVIAGYATFCATDTCNPVITNSIIIVNNVSDAYGIRIEGGGNTATNNIVLKDPGFTNSRKGIGVEFDAKTNIIKNNIVSGFRRNIEGLSSDTAIVHNNIAVNGVERGITINALTGMRNNIISKNGVGLVYPTVSSSDYNLFWQNNSHTSGQLGQNDIISDPMFVNDTIPVFGGTYDYHLQMFSPAIDAGDPNILDVDGTRSDIGAYGGPGGQSYIYIDLPPRPPVNVTAIVDSISITISWNRNTEADTSHYNVYRDTVANFIIDPSKLVSSQTDSFYIQYPPYQSSKYVYKITCVDNQGNESLPSEELIINITSLTMNDYPITINDYLLYQNYPNPFNPSTRIGYKLKESGYVKLMVYDIKGELISVLVNQVQEAGYYEVEFNVAQDSSPAIASGIYLYRIEVIGEGNIPQFSDMKKMLLIK